MNRLVTLILLAAWMVPAVVPAETLRCGSNLIRVGDTKLDVIRFCGEPFFREVISGANERNEEQWFYVPAATQFQRSVTFRGTRVVRIEIKTW